MNLMVHLWGDDKAPIFKSQSQYKTAKQAQQEQPTETRGNTEECLQYWKPKEETVWEEGNAQHLLWNAKQATGITFLYSTHILPKEEKGNAHTRITQFT